MKRNSEKKKKKGFCKVGENHLVPVAETEEESVYIVVQIY